MKAWLQVKPFRRTPLKSVKEVVRNTVGVVKFDNCNRNRVTAAGQERNCTCETRNAIYGITYLTIKIRKTLANISPHAKIEVGKKKQT